ENRTIRIPDVFTDAHPDRRTVDLQDGTPSACLEISEFVENSVIGEIDLVIRRNELSILRDSSRIENVVFPVDESNDGGDVPSPADDFVESGEIGIDELRLQKQIFRRVARQRELGKCDNVSIRVARAVHPFRNFLRVSL